MPNFSSGKPVLAAADAAGFTAANLVASGAGVCAPGERPDLLLNESLRLWTDPTVSGQLGEAVRRHCENLLSEVVALDLDE
jgi:colanic acid biosynthesis glycosyl transferase WcaI